MSKKNITLPNVDSEELTALAFTDFSKPSPILKGKDAERFIRLMEENERKAEELARLPKTKEEAERELSYNKILYNFEKDRLKDIEERTKKLEDYIKSFNGKEQEF